MRFLELSFSWLSGLAIVANALEGITLFAVAAINIIILITHVKNFKAHKKNKP